jgi:anti-sigma B factor antagonist
MSASTSKGAGAEVVLFFSGEIDLATAPQMWDAIASSVGPDTRRLVLDFSDVTFIDASGISVIVRARFSLGEDGQVVLRRPRPSARRVFEIVHLDELGGVELTPGGPRDAPERGDGLSNGARIIALSPDTPVRGSPTPAGDGAEQPVDGRTLNTSHPIQHRRRRPTR